MTKRIISLIVFSIGIFTLLQTYSCQKDQSIEVIIRVKLMSDTMQLVPDARINMVQDSTNVLGYSDKNGELTITFYDFTQFEIQASKDTLFGSAYIYLSEKGQSYCKSVFVH